MSLDTTRVDLLRRVWLFKELDDSELAQIAAVSRERACLGGEVLFRQDDDSGDLYTIIQGRLKVTSIAPAGDEVLLSVMKPGQAFGELALLDELPRSATVSAVEHCRLLVVPRTSFRPLLLQMPSLGLRLLQALAGLVRDLSNRVEAASTLDVRTRLARKLLELGQGSGAPAPRGAIRVTLPMSQPELGRWVGATREMINKCLGELRRKGIVRHERRMLTILKPHALQTLAEDVGSRQARSARARKKKSSKKRRRNGTVKPVPDRP